MNSQYWDPIDHGAFNCTRLNLKRIVHVNYIKYVFIHGKNNIKNNINSSSINFIYTNLYHMIQRTIPVKLCCICPSGFVREKWIYVQPIDVDDGWKVMTRVRRSVIDVFIEHFLSKLFCPWVSFNTIRGPDGSMS